MKAKMSVCFIVRNDAASGLLDECFQSVRPHVEEIVVVDTGSNDGGATEAICRKYADKYEVFVGCNDPPTVEGAIADFSVARNRSLDLASHPWVMWMDSDDRLRGGEMLERLIAVAEANRGTRDWCYLFPYEYAYNAAGRCTCLHYRERLVSNPKVMRWVNPVHEVLLPQPDANLVLVPCDDVVFEHQRHRSKKGGEGGRNLRILQKLVEVDGTEDARHFYYLGLEYANAGQLDNATKWLSKYTGVSGWDDEKTMAALKLAEICYARAYAPGVDQAAFLAFLNEGIRWAFKAVETHETWGEGYFALARGFYGLAMRGESAGNPRRNWERCAYFAKTGLALPPTKTLLFVNPIEREYDIHVYLNMALSQLGDVKGALESAEAALKANPSDPNLVYNRKIFARSIARDEIQASLGKLLAVEGIDAGAKASIDQILANGRVVAGEVPGSAIGEWADWPRRPDYPRNVTASDFPVARPTPHARAWGIPTDAVLDDLPVQMTPEQLEAAVILVWKEYVLHDEMMAAERFLADAPYRTKHSVKVQQALAMTRATMAWMDDKAESQRINAPADVMVENGVPLPGPLNGQLLNRSDLALARVAKSERILDFGCFDGGITNRWGMAGYNVEALDLCATSVALANRKAVEFRTGVKHHVGYFKDGPAILSRKFDVVTSTDTYEHVKDQVGDFIHPAREMLAEHGRMIVVTPHGAWMRGEFVPWAHPWVWSEQKGAAWNAPIERAHLVAPTVWTAAENFRRDGWWVRDSMVCLSQPFDVPGQGNVVVEAFKNDPRPRPDGGALDVVFACGDAWEQWNPEIMRRQGIGGSETAVVEMARRLSALGHRVRVFTSTGEYGEGVFDGVEYHASTKLALVEACDVLVAWRNAELLLPRVRARAKLLWVHDIFASGAAHKNLLHADKVLGLSAWHCEYLRQHHNLPATQLLQTRNGIDLARFAERGASRNEKKIVYSSSPDRGLPALLQMWPEIRRQVPDAELHVFYGFENWRKLAQARNDGAQLAAIDALLARMQQLSAEGVHYRGRVNQQELAFEFMSAGVWAYPTWFSETSCCHPDTRISIPGDHRGGPPTVRIADLVGKSGFPVYAFNEAEHRFEIATCKKVWLTKIAEEMVAIRLDDGQLLRLTPDHKVLTFDGEWVEAGTLKPGDSLRALHYRYNVAIRDADGTWTNEHRLVGEWMMGRALRSDEHVDHEDLLRLDNRPEALTVMSAREHASKTHAGKRQSKLHGAKRIAGWRAWATSPEGRADLVARHKKNGRKLWDMVNAMSPDDRAAWLAARAEKKRQTMLARAVGGARYGENHKVVSVERIPGGPVYDMEVERLHNFVADGVVVHNCITAMEAQAAGLRIVTSPLAALNETVGEDRGVFIDGDWLSEPYQRRFVEETVRALTAPEGAWLTTRAALREHAVASFGWASLAEDWERMFRRTIAEAGDRPMAPYQPRADFKREAA